MSSETPGVIRWESPYGDEPEFASTLRNNPGRWAVIYEGSGTDWAASEMLRWITKSDEADGFEYAWIQIDKDGRPVQPALIALRVEYQGRGRAYARYDPPEDAAQVEDG